MGLFDVFKKKEEAAPAPVVWPVAVAAVTKGKVLKMDEVPDPVFSQGILGQCCGIDPVEGQVYAPVDGEVSQIADSKHAIGFTAPGGVEVLIHVGVDTVDMNGDGFAPKIKVGDKVNKGQLVLTMDMDKIAAAGHPSTVIIVITNSDDFASVALVGAGDIEVGADLFKIKPGWTVSLNIYATVIARPSERKTPALQVMAHPLYIFKREENHRLVPLIAEQQMKRDILNKQILNMKEALAKSALKTDKPASFDDITELQYQLSDLEREAVKPLRLLSDDCTPEALVSLMAVNDGKIGIISDEGGIFDTIAGKYSNGKVNMDVFLKGYDGSSLRVDRKGRDKEDINRPLLTMLLMVQPLVLETIMKNPNFAGRGFLSRPLYALPKTRMGHREYRTPPISPEAEQAYRPMSIRQ